MTFLPIILITLFSLSNPVACYHDARDDRKITFDESDTSDYVSVLKENELFKSSGICAADNRSYLGLCESKKPVNSLFELQRTLCFCDEACHFYHDCCFNRVFPNDEPNLISSCRTVRDENGSRISIYVVQKCHYLWNNSDVQTMCEKESAALEYSKKSYSHLQDIPVLSKRSRIFFRNIYCAICNYDTDIVTWKSFMYCNGDSSRESVNKEQDVYDFSSAVYSTRDQNFKRVKVGGKLKNCRLVINDFKLSSLLEYQARLCKPMIDNCLPGSPSELELKCRSFTSFVYEISFQSTRKVYKNFYCALCNQGSVNKLRCKDPEYPIIHGPQTGRGDLSWLFDFNFVNDGSNQVGDKNPCRLREGKIWDPLLKRCEQFVCGSLYVREGSKCVPKNFSETENPSKGIKSDCPKRILTKEMFTLTNNGSFYVNYSNTFLKQEEYEIYEKNGEDVIRIAICAKELYLLPMTSVYLLLSEITLSLSIICLVLNISVYTILKELRNGPGKILMSLSLSLLCGHFFLLTGTHFAEVNWLCYFAAVATHFGYIASFCWMTVMAFDIHRTFSATQRRNSKHKPFFNYSLYSWISSLSLVVVSVTMDNSLDKDFEFRPKYGEPICWFNNKKGLLMFFIIPVLVLLVSNITFFSLTAFYLHKISRQTKMVNNFSDRTRYLLYIKLTVVLGLAWLLGFFAGITGINALWYPFIILNGLQGVFIFVAFTCKVKIFHKLAIKFKIRSSSYTMGKQSALKKAMYSSLSNLSTLGTTLTSQIISAVEKPPGMLKAVRKINPDEL
ncbi:uncharacterized protein LOC129230358 [Uloborus diversus]|uniref:uncharacterized protein LOC129230358 n=1 Tax=Uloborus diversus TaxID=327109 RepID=UPI00240971C0|nr:uncharacterized protein LOC129230358 [Uloborus diversus]